MSNASHVRLCPKCSNELIHTDCKICGWKPRRKRDLVLEAPAYISYQIDTFLKNKTCPICAEKEQGVGTPLEGTNCPQCGDWRQTLVKNWFIDAHPDDIYFAMTDALMVMRYLVHAQQVGGNNIKTAATLGKRIGEMSEIISKYIQLGGHIYEHQSTTSTKESNSDPQGLE